VTGLSGLTYLDNMEGRTPKSEAGEKLMFCREVDRVYVSVPDKILVSGSGVYLDLNFKIQNEHQRVKLVFCGEVDRVYVSAPDKILVSGSKFF
jgi:hypothetical protein